MIRRFDDVAAGIAVRAKAVDEERDRLDRLIARHQRRRDGLMRPGPRDYLQDVFSIACAPLAGARFEISGPFGMGPEYGVTVDADDGHAYFTFRGSDTSARLVDPESDDRRFHEGSMGRLNGLHHSAADLDPDPAVLTATILAQMAENRLRAMAAEGVAA